MQRYRIPTAFLMILTLFLLAGCVQADRDEVFQKARDTFDSWDQYSLETTMTLGPDDISRDFVLKIHHDSTLDERYVEWYVVDDSERLLLLYIYAKDEAVYVFNDAEHQNVDGGDEYRIEPRSQFESDIPDAKEVIDETLGAFPSNLEKTESTIRGDAFTYKGEGSDGTWVVEGDEDGMTIETSDPRIGTVTIEKSDFLETFEGIDEQKHIDWENKNN